VETKQILEFPTDHSSRTEAISDNIHHFLASESGLSVEFIRRKIRNTGFGNILNSQDQVLLRLFPGEENQVVRNVFCWVESTPINSKTVKDYEWLELLKAWVQVGSGQKHLDDLFTIVADNGLVALKRDLTDWKRDPMSIANIVNLDPFLLEQKDLILPRAPELDRLIRHIQHRGIEELNKGRIPITRILSFTDAKEQVEMSNLAAEVLASGTEFQINNQPGLANLTLHDVESHKAWPAKGSPLASWTFAPLDSHPAMGSLVTNRSIILLSSLSMDEICWSRVADQGIRDDVPPLWRWYVGKEVDAPNLDGDLKLIDLNLRNIHAGIFPSESESTIWSSLPNLGVFSV